MEEPKKTCKNCIFYVTLPNWNGVGTCHENSPAPYTSKDADPNDGGTIWPKVIGDDPNFWCGKWVAAGIDLEDVELKRDEGTEI